jgi:hypothetical protein
MSKRWWWLSLAALCLAHPGAQAVELTALEQTWLEAAMPVLQFAREQALPLDIIVQPQPAPGETPLGMAFIEGRCKLVLSMRGNPEAQSTLDGIQRELLGPVVEAIAAHELAHCWRHVQNRWGTLPGALQEAPVLMKVSQDNAQLLREMWRTRREEGFADLVGLAWTQRHHPEKYVQVHAWHVRLRADQPLETGPHDTRAWVRLAADPARFAPAASLFEQVAPLWVDGLVAPAGEH